MATQLKVDNATIDGDAIATSAFVAGSCSYSPDVKMNEVVTSDGKLHQVPMHVEGTASFEMHGDGTEHNTGLGNGVTVILKTGASAVATFTGLVSASYDESEHKTKLDIKIDPSVDLT
jgi:hypothetical protein